MRTCCGSGMAAAYDPLDPLLLPDWQSAVAPWLLQASQVPAAASASWSAMVERIRAADESVWSQAEAAAKETAPAAAGILEFLRANKTAVYWISGGLMALALLRRR